MDDQGPKVEYAAKMMPEMPSLDEMMAFDLNFADVEIAGVHGVVAIGLTDGKLHAGAGLTAEEATFAMFRSVYPELRKIAVAPSAAIAAGKMFADEARRERVGSRRRKRVQ